MKIIYRHKFLTMNYKKTYEVKSDLGCEFLKVLLNNTKENNEVELFLYEDVFKDLVNGKINESFIRKLIDDEEHGDKIPYTTTYLYEALLYFGCNLFNKIAIKDVFCRLYMLEQTSIEHVDNYTVKWYDWAYDGTNILLRKLRTNFFVETGRVGHLFYTQTIYYPPIYTIERSCENVNKTTQKYSKIHQALEWKICHDIQMYMTEQLKMEDILQN